MTTPLKKVPIHLQSAQNRLIIKNGSVVNAEGIDQVDIYVEDCKIKQIGNHLIIPGGTRVVDATGKLVLPGGIDVNVHFQTPANGTQTIDDFYQGTKAAIADGTTMIIDCVKPEAGESLVEAYNKWRIWADSKVCCDYGLKVAVDKIDESVKREMAELASEEFGVNTFSVSMSVLKDSELLDVFETCAALGGLAYVHAESGEIIERNERKMIERGITGPEGFALAHSEMAEEEATMRATTLANQINCPIYIADIMSPLAAEIVTRKKIRGSVVFAETLVAGIACDGENYWNKCWTHAAGFVCSPPIRSGSAKDELCDALVSEALDVIASKHATFNAKQKSLGKTDFRQIPIGVNGAEARMSILWEKCVHSGKMDPTQFVAVTSANPAKIFNLFPRKGCITLGSDADIVIWDPSATKIHTAQNHNIKCDFNIFEGLECHGVAETVICGGRIMVDELQLRVMQGYGNFIPMANFAPYIYEKVKAKAAAADSFQPVVRSEADMMTTNGSNINDEDDDEPIPGPPTPPKTQVSPAPSQHGSNFDLKSHPNVPDVTVGQPTPASQRPATVRVRAPPGGKSTGFW